MKKVIVLLVVILASFLSYRVAYLIGENFFFDKLFYNKSTLHGYWRKGIDDLDNFPLRGQDIREIYNYLDAQKNGLDNYQRLVDQDTFLINVLGDSYVWGAGVRPEQRFVTLLEKKLNKIRPTRVLSLAMAGDNVFEHLAKYQISKKVFGEADIYMFGMVSNDLLLNNPHRYQSKFADKSFADCSSEIIYDYKNGKNSEYVEHLLYADKINLSVDYASQNWCVYQELASQLPSEKTIYLDLDGFRFDWESNSKIMNQLKTNNLQVFSFQEYQQKKYSKPLSGLFKKQPFSVTELEAHPSSLAHRIYAEALFEEITTNPEWGFNKQ